jgi:hypothetical protein
MLGEMPGVADTAFEPLTASAATGYLVTRRDGRGLGSGRWANRRPSLGQAWKRRAVHWQGSPETLAQAPGGGRRCGNQTS